MYVYKIAEFYHLQDQITSLPRCRLCNMQNRPQHVVSHAWNAALGSGATFNVHAESSSSCGTSAWREGKCRRHVECCGICMNLFFGMVFFFGGFTVSWLKMDEVLKLETMHGNCAWGYDCVQNGL
jgi:hypothetical protein